MAVIPRKLLIVKRDPEKGQDRTGYNVMIEVSNTQTLSLQVPEVVGERLMAETQSLILTILVQSGFVPPRRGERS